MFSTILLAASLVPVQDVPEGHVHPVQHLVHVEVTPRSVRRLLALDLDVAKLDLVSSLAEVIVTPDELELLAASGLTHRIEIRDLARYYAARLAAGAGQGPAAGSYGAWLNPPFAGGGMGGYYTFAQIESVLDQMRATYPSLISAKQSLGNSIQGRPQWMVRISDNPDTDEAEPEVRFDALHHAREPEGMQASLWFMLYLLEEYGSDPVATYLVDNRELYFVPCVNPDGYEYNRQIAPGGGGLWRKNRRNNGGGSFGVDLNRNYTYNWGFDNSGSSGNPDSEVYRGTGPASEPEVASMVSFLAGRQFNTALSVHTYGNYWLAPWGYDTLYPANWSAYDEVGTQATSVNGYAHGPASILLYKANGVTIDTDHGQYGTLSWTPEIGNSGDGFWPAQSRIVPLAEDNLWAYTSTALAGGAWVRGVQLDLVDAGDGDGSFEGGEAVEITALLRNSGTLQSGLVGLVLSTSSPYLTVSQAGANVGPIAAFSDGTNAQALVLNVAPGTPGGTIADFTVDLTYDGWSQTLAGELFIGTEVVLASYDFEAGGAQGWAVGAPNDASTGEWTRVDPNGTAAQPEDDHTSSPGVRCWITGQGSPGGSLGSNDVDGGSTTLVSPTWDLAGTIAPRISYWRWYSNDQGSAPNADVLQIDLSNDGGASWVTAETVGPAGAGSNGGWYEAQLDVASILAPTNQVRMRVVASDLGSGSIVEAGLDDVIVSYLDGDSCSTPSNFCVAAPNSAGPGAIMGWSGSTDATDANFNLSVSGAPPTQFGLFFYGPSQQQVPVGDGFLCLGGSLVRLPVVTVDALGGAFQPVDLAGQGLFNGQTWNFQFWYRDPAGGPAGNNLSDGLEVEFCGG
jgi:carboxypeptidase T